ncbi:HutD/Ves family protein [Shewanella mangrovi]|uniref:HutD/Ves family protein n=1 Tax=Shewanella mangrovi TaxID=1515746 RepID=UPI00068DA8B9|nr:HutD family protein [Shewanella mangrovi]
MSVTCLPRRLFKQVPWKNGQGITEEIALQQDLNERFTWRLSIATVAQDGLFSHFNGYQRIISVLAGNGMLLAVNGCESGPITCFQSFHFDGSATTDCRLIDGAIYDFNVIFDDKRVEVDVTWHALSSVETLSLAADTTFFLLVGEGELDVDVEQQSYSLAAWDVLKFEPIVQTRVLNFTTTRKVMVALVTIVNK